MVIKHSKIDGYATFPTIAVILNRTGQVTYVDKTQPWELPEIIRICHERLRIKLRLMGNEFGFTRVKLLSEVAHGNFRLSMVCIESGTHRELLSSICEVAWESGNYLYQVTQSIQTITGKPSTLNHKQDAGAITSLLYTVDLTPWEV